MVKFAYTTLYVNDVAQTIDFYVKALGCQVKFIAPDGSYGELITGETTLSFAAHSLASTNFKDGFTESSIQDKPFGIEIGFTTTDVAATMAQALQAGATLYAEPKTKPWGQTVAYVRDINGFLIEICTAVS